MLWMMFAPNHGLRTWYKLQTTWCIYTLLWFGHPSDTLGAQWCCRWIQLVGLVESLNCSLCLARTGAMFFFIETWATKAVASLVRGEGQEKHLSQPNVQEKSALLLFPLESMCWEASAPLQAACVSLPRFSRLYCALVCSAKSRPSGSSPASHVVGLAQCGVPGLCFHRHDSRAAVWEGGAHLQHVWRFYICTSYRWGSIQYVKSWSRLFIGLSGAWCWCAEIHECTYQPIIFLFNDIVSSQFILAVRFKTCNQRFMVEGQAYIAILPNLSCLLYVLYVDFADGIWYTSSCFRRKRCGCPLLPALAN